MWRWRGRVGGWRWFRRILDALIPTHDLRILYLWAIDGGMSGLVHTRSPARSQARSMWRAETCCPAPHHLVCENKKPCVPRDVMLPLATTSVLKAVLPTVCHVWNGDASRYSGFLDSQGGISRFYSTGKHKTWLLYLELYKQ
jgi:hypothetical protein